MSEKGLVQVFTGDGRGKTSAGLGTVMRAAGYGLKVFAVFFMKGFHDRGEYTSLRKLGVEYSVNGRPGFLGPSYTKDEDRDLASEALKIANDATQSGKYDLVLLDEINTVVAWNLVDLRTVLKLIDGKAPSTELILTGRYADDRIIARADYVTKLDSIKHPFDNGIVAREGIDY